MSIYHIDPLGADHNNEILKVLHSAPNVTENLKVCFDREPDFFRLPEIRYHPYYYYGYFRNDVLKGFCGIGYHDAMVNGRHETVFHMRDYYVMPESRGIGFGLKVAEKFYRETYNNAVLGYVLILTGNKASLGYIGYRNVLLPYIPYSRIINQLDVRNIMLVFPVRNSPKYIIRKAESKDIPEITDLLNNEHKDRLFGKLFDKSTFQRYLENCPGLNINDFYLALDRKGIPCGVCAAWDCSSFKQTKVLKYGKSFRVLKVLYKGLSKVYNVPPLPAPNECFKDIIITDYAARNRNPEIMNALLRNIYNDYRKRGFHNLMWGSSADDPLLSASKGFFYQRIVSNIVLISTDKSLVVSGAIRDNLPYIDLPCL